MFSKIWMLVCTQSTQSIDQRYRWRRNNLKPGCAGITYKHQNARNNKLHCKVWIPITVKSSILTTFIAHSLKDFPVKMCDIYDKLFANVSTHVISCLCGQVIYVDRITLPVIWQEIAGIFWKQKNYFLYKGNGCWYKSQNSPKANKQI